MSLKPQNIVQAASADLRRRDRKREGAEDKRAPYAFHRLHVSKAESQLQLLQLAMKDRDRGIASGKPNTRLIYGDDALLRRALLVAGGG